MEYASPTPAFDPPPPSGPPPIIGAPPPPPPRKGRGWMIFAIILLVLLFLSVLGNFGQFVSGVVTMGGAPSKTAGPKLDEVYLEDNGSPNKIAVIRVSGIISSSELDQTGY
ncbi:MAG TPA: hypothetical protein VKA67_04710, partial [Verrucomicrobiae bacterium]|nr:hypothetical protein [Verrucomicrobiae bacterium]